MGLSLAPSAPGLPGIPGITTFPALPNAPSLGGIVHRGLKGLVDQGTATIDVALRQSARNVEVLVHTLDEETQRAIDNAISDVDRDIANSAQTLVKSAGEVVDASKAVVRFAERQIRSYPENLSHAEKRIREGKVADAIWHLGTDGIRSSNKNAARLANENEMISQAAQAAAGFYGGPAGAAAFASWKTYNDSQGDLDLAIRAGVYAYAVNAGYTGTSDLPTGSVGEIAKKAATNGAVAGAAVAASGGRSEEALEAFVRKGGAIIVQSSEAYVQQTYAGNASVEVDSYCSTILGEPCAEAQQWLDQARGFADRASAYANDRATTKATSDGRWAISWNSEALAEPTSDVPPVSLSYIGEGSSYQRKIEAITRLVSSNGGDMRYGNSARRPAQPLLSYFGPPINADPNLLRKSFPSGVWKAVNGYELFEYKTDVINYPSTIRYVISNGKVDRVMFISFSEYSLTASSRSTRVLGSAAATIQFCDDRFSLYEQALRQSVVSIVDRPIFNETDISERLRPFSGYCQEDIWSCTRYGVVRSKTGIYNHPARLTLKSVLTNTVHDELQTRIDSDGETPGMLYESTSCNVTLTIEDPSLL